jgi:hypothetical protein
MAMDLNTLQQLLDQKAAAQANQGNLESQYARAEALRDQKFGAPSDANYGHVSPLSMLATLGNRYLGRQQIRDLEPQIADVNRQVGKADAAETMYGLVKAKEQADQQQRNWEDTAAATQAYRDQQQANWQATHDQGIYESVRDFNATQGKEQLERERLARKEVFDNRKKDADETFIHPEHGLIHTIMDSHGRRYIDNGKELTPVDVTGLEPYHKPGTGGKKSAGQEKRDAEADTKLRQSVESIDPFLSILHNKHLAMRTGYSTGRIMGAMGIGFGDSTGSEHFPSQKEASEGVSLGHEIAGFTLKAIAPKLEMLGVNPTDRDLAIAMESAPGKGSNEWAWYTWGKDVYLPRMRRAVATGVAEGRMTPERAEMIIDVLEKGLEKGRKMWEPGSNVNVATPEDQQPTESPGWGAVEEVQ